ncbi:hypothetical protein J3459_010281 [Metarhizium acridum]|nr:hypothetical protein J3459_010281 [Metarhizium acridum]
MSFLIDPSGQLVAFAGKFIKNQNILENYMKKWGAKPAKREPPTVLAATEAAFHKPSNAVQYARQRKIFILNEDWVNECIENDSWIPPEDKHIWERGVTDHPTDDSNEEPLQQPTEEAPGEPAEKPAERPAERPVEKPPSSAGKMHESDGAVNGAGYNQMQPESQNQVPTSQYICYF